MNCFPFSFLLSAMLNTILANWTAHFSQHINDQFQVNATNRVSMVTEEKPTEKREPEVIEVDSVEPPTPGIAHAMQK